VLKQNCPVIKNFKKLNNAMSLKRWQAPLGAVGAGKNNASRLKGWQAPFEA